MNKRANGRTSRNSFPGQPLCHSTTHAHSSTSFILALFLKIFVLFSLLLFSFCRECQRHHLLPAPFSLCFITPGAPGCCICRCVAMETETHFWSRWVFRRFFFFWQLSVFGPSWTPIGCHWVMWPMTSSGVVVMNLPPPPLSLPVQLSMCVHVCDRDW